MITGAIAGVFLADYWILKATILDIKELYSATGVNWHLGSQLFFCVFFWTQKFLGKKSGAHGTWTIPLSGFVFGHLEPIDSLPKCRPGIFFIQ